MNKPLRNKMEVSNLSLANAKLRMGSYEDAIRLYVREIIGNPGLESILEFNLRLAQYKFIQGSQHKKRVTISCLVKGECEDYLLAEYANKKNKISSVHLVYQETAARPTIQSRPFLTSTLKADNNPAFIKDSLELVLSHPAHIVHLHGHDITNIIVGIFYKWVWGAGVFLCDCQESAGRNVTSHRPLLTGLQEKQWVVAVGQALKLFDSLELRRRITSDIYSLVTDRNRIAIDGVDKFVREPAISLVATKESLLNLMIGQLRSGYGGKPPEGKNTNIISISKSDQPSAETDVTELEKSNIELIRASGLFDEAWYRQTYSIPDSQDPVLHYLRVGPKEGFDPSSEFSTKYYLARYKSVGESGINPLIHYIKHGKKEGRVTKEINDICDSRDHSGIDVYISCWLRNRESIHDGLLDFYNRLRAAGLRVKFVTHTEALYQEKNVDALNVPFAILGTNFYDGEPEIEPPAELENDVYAVLYKRLEFIRNFTFLSNRKLLISQIRKAYSYWYRSFENNKPAFCIVWGSTCPMSRLHIHLCRKMNVPYLIMERGHFSGTVSVDTLGQFGFSGQSLIPALITNDEKRFEALREWIRNVEEVPYAHKNVKKGLDDRILYARESGKKVVLFIGVNDTGSGIAYDLDSAESHSFFYRSSLDAAKGVIEALIAAKIDALIVIKPHPADNADYSGLVSDNVVVENEGNINDLIMASDICVTMSTTSIARCLVEEKPVVVLSLTDVSALNIAYECNDPSELVAKLRSAIEREGYEEKLVNGKKFIQYLFDNKLFSVERNGLFQSMEDFAERISRKIYLLRKSPYLRKVSEVEKKGLSGCDYEEYEFDGSLSVPEKYRLPVDIVIPVYADAALTRSAIEAALSALDDDDTRIIVINDASPYPDVDDLMQELVRAGSERLIILHNERNLGFSGTVNRAIEWSARRDVLLLNSDAVVPKGFLSRMKSAAYSHYRVATVTPFSNNAGIYSIPLAGGESLDRNGALEKVQFMDDQLKARNSGRAISMPVGHGFCMYLRRSALDQIGYFNEQVFGRGYSEEIDFCLRARSIKFLNLIVPSVYVGHVGGVSFGNEGDESRTRNRQIIDRRYPGYYRELRAFRSNDPLKSYRDV